MTDEYEVFPDVAPPELPELPAGRRATLVSHVVDALVSLPAYFASSTVIDGMESQDLFALNSVLGGAIEVQVVETLNRIRKVWDPDDEWVEYRFERSAQTFPDVRLVARIGGELKIALGVELKGWYLLAKERVPTFRYQVTPDACDEHDLLVVVPWHLRNVLAGAPTVHEPHVLPARFVAEYRNYWWQHVRDSKGEDTTIVSPPEVHPYPDAKSVSSDHPVHDSGDNFGRIARTGLLKAWTDEMVLRRIAGVEARHWISFLKAYAESADPEQLSRRVDALITRVTKARKAARKDMDDEDAGRIGELLGELAELLNPA